MFKSKLQKGATTAYHAIRVDHTRRPGYFAGTQSDVRFQLVLLLLQPTLQNITGMIDLSDLRRHTILRSASPQREQSKVFRLQRRWTSHRGNSNYVLYFK